MSILNLGLQGVALERKRVEDIFESKLKACGSVSDIRKVAEKVPRLKDAFTDSIQQPLLKVCDRLSHLHLKEEKVRCLLTTATEEQLTELFEFAKKVDASLTYSDSTKAELLKKSNLQLLLSTHCRIRHYMLQIKCDKDCIFCASKRRPEKVFSNLLWICPKW